MKKEITQIANTFIASVKQGEGFEEVVIATKSFKTLSGAKKWLANK